MSEEQKPAPVRSGVFVHSSVYALGNIATRVGSFLLLPLYTHHLSVADYGALEMFYVVSSVVSSLLSVGLAHATLRFYFEFDDISDRNKVVTSCLISTVLYAGPLLLILSYFNAPLSKVVFGTVSFASGFYWVFGILILELMRQIGLAYFRAREYSVRYVAVCVLQLFIQVGCNLYTVGVQKGGVLGILKGNFVSVAVGWAFIMFLIVKECGIRFDFSKMKTIFKYSYPFLLTSITSVVLSNLDRIILRAFFSLHEVGLYALAYKFGSLIQELVIDPFTRSFGAYRFKIMRDADARAELARVFSRFMVILVVVVLGVSLFSQDAIRILTGPDFWAAHKIIPIIAFSFLVAGAGYQFQTGLLFEKKTHHLITINLVSSAFNLFFYLILIPWLGTYGAALAVLGKNAVEAIYTYRVSQKYFPIPFGFLGPLKTLVVAAIFVGVAGVVAGRVFWLTIPVEMALFVGFLLFLYKAGEIQHGEITQCVSILKNFIERFRSRFAGG